MAKVNHVRELRSNALDKQSEKEKRSSVYTTEVINQIIKAQASGGAPDMSPFWHGQTDYRDSGITFEYTDWEKNELEKCAEDCLYFVRHYCKFLNDKGRTLVNLRPYQERLLNLLSAEKYDEVSDTVIPANKEIIMMQSRQTGKCVSMLTDISVADDYPLENLSDYTFGSYIKKQWNRMLNTLFHR